MEEGERASARGRRADHIDQSPTPSPPPPPLSDAVRAFAAAARAAGTLPSILLPPASAAASASVPSWSDVAAARRGAPPLGPDGRPAAWASVKRAATATKARPGRRVAGEEPPSPHTATPSTAAASRAFTSRYRGVHQTLPTRRWEAQFRRGGKPTSLGCFDREEDAARAYDRAVLWRALHGATGAKGGVTNFEPAEYAAEVESLRAQTLDQLVDGLRAAGRRQARDRQARAAAVKAVGRQRSEGA